MIVPSMIVVADTSGLLAAFDAGEREHTRARGVLSRETLVISPLVLTELDHLVHREFGFRAAIAAIEALTTRVADGQYALAEVSNDDLETAARVRTEYADLELDLSDGVGVAIAEKYRTNRIFTLDHRDFRAIRPLSPEFSSFLLLPSDA